MRATILAKRIQCLPVATCYCQDGIIMSTAPESGSYVKIDKRRRKNPMIFAHVALFEDRSMQDEFLFNMDGDEIADITTTTPAPRLLRWMTKVLEQLPPPTSECRGE